MEGLEREEVKVCSRGERIFTLFYIIDLCCWTHIFCSHRTRVHTCSRTLAVCVRICSTSSEKWKFLYFHSSSSLSLISTLFFFPALVCLLLPSLLIPLANESSNFSEEIKNSERIFHVLRIYLFNFSTPSNMRRF